MMILAKRYKLLAVLALVILAGLVLPVAAGAGALEDALDNPLQPDGSTPLAFVTTSTSGTAPWSAVTTTYYSGGASAQSSAIGGTQYTRLETTVTGTASISFYQKESSELTNE